MKRGFSLVELVTVLAIMTIGIGLFYSVLFTNWLSLERQLLLIDLQMEADKIVDMLSFDCKNSVKVDVSPEGKTVIFTFIDAPKNITYSIAAPTNTKSSGELTRTIGDKTDVISGYVDYDNSIFKKEINTLVMELFLKDYVFGRVMRLPISTQIYPRNLLAL